MTMIIIIAKILERRETTINVTFNNIHIVKEFGGSLYTTTTCPYIACVVA